MPVNQHPFERRTCFDQVAEDYQAVRPGYPPPLIEAVVSLAAIPPEGRILEIGCGPGQATISFAGLGYRMTCLDLGPALLDRAAERCRAYPNVQFHLSAFEDWPEEPKTFDLAIAATAFHWIPPEIGYPKAARLLKDSGALAIFSNEHPAQSDRFFTEVNEIYQQLVPEWSPRYTNEMIEQKVQESIDSTIRAIEATELFEPVILGTYPWTEKYTARTYPRLLNTYSDYRGLDADRRERLFQAISELIEKDYGGTITRQYRSVLYFAKKR
ncbi:MAG TPA: class I SAM-dependent methyltransferase [Blastocatellia bacterium]|nr:class I SAM-dependent methyltransferase [Blastocatellia bacterium]